jgi:hypothetical protein
MEEGRKMSGFYSARITWRIVLSGLILLSLAMSALPAPVHAQEKKTPKYKFWFYLEGEITVDPSSNYTPSYNKETSVGCFGNYANQFGEGDGNVGPDGNIDEWGRIYSDGSMDGGCLIQEDPTNGYRI